MVKNKIGKHIKTIKKANTAPNSGFFVNPPTKRPRGIALITSTNPNINPFCTNL